MTVNNRIFHYGFLICIVSVTLIGCVKHTPSDDLLDKSPFTGNPCSPPCWHGLMVGESDESEVLSILPQLIFINQDTIRTHRMSLLSIDFKTHIPGVRFTANCIYPNEKCLTIDVADDILTEIDIILNYEKIAGEAIKDLGNPDYVGYKNLGAEQIMCAVYLVWKTKQLILSSTFEGIKNVKNNCYVVRDAGKPSSNLIISEVSYSSIASIEYLLATGAGEFFKFTGTIQE